MTSHLLWEKKGEILEIRECPSETCLPRLAYLKIKSRAESLEEELNLIKMEKVQYENAFKLLLQKVNDNLFDPINIASSFLREDLSKIPVVSEIYYSKDDDVNYYWIYTSEENFDEEIKIADTMGKLMRIFKNLRFDFMIIPISEKVDGILPKKTERILPV